MLKGTLSISHETIDQDPQVLAARFVRRAIRVGRLECNRDVLFKQDDEAGYKKRKKEKGGTLKRIERQ